MEDNMEVESNELDEFEKELETMKELEKVALLIDKLKNENYNVRLFCVKQLPTIAQLLGPNRIEEELIPLIIDHVINSEDNDEVLLEVSNQLINLIDFLQNKTNISLILKGLELLASNDDEIVRQQATENLCKLIDTLDEVMITNEIFPLMQRLIQNDMKSKVSCCYLFSVVYPKLNNEQIKKELIQAYHEISRDDSPSVRRAAAHNIKNFSSIEDPELIGELVSLHSDMLKDNIDIVKVFAIGSTKNLLLKLPHDERKQLITNFNTAVNRDKSWRVKYAASEAICEICSFFDASFNEQNFLPMVMLFLKDSEPEVRSSVISKIDVFVGYISAQKFLSNIFPIFQDSICADNNHHVRALFASSIVKCCKYFDASVFEKNLFTFLNKVFKDEVIEVRISALSHIDQLCGFFKNDNIMINQLLPSFLEISKDTKWRVRLAFAEKMNEIVEVCPRDQFISYFLPIINNFFTDHAQQIREYTWKIYDKLGKDDPNFIKKNVWDNQKNTLNSNNYIMRISALNSINYLKHYYEENFLIENVFPTIIQMKQDNVANVKFNLSNLLKSLFNFIHSKLGAGFSKFKFESIINEIRVLLTGMAKESDSDVKFFSNETLNFLNSNF